MAPLTSQLPSRQATSKRTAPGFSTTPISPAPSSVARPSKALATATGSPWLQANTRPRSTVTSGVPAASADSPTSAPASRYSRAPLGKTSCVRPSSTARVTCVPACKGSSAPVVSGCARPPSVDTLAEPTSATSAAPATGGGAVGSGVGVVVGGSVGAAVGSVVAAPPAIGVAAGSGDGRSRKNAASPPIISNASSPSTSGVRVARRGAGWATPPAPGT